MSAYGRGNIEKDMYSTDAPIKMSGFVILFLSFKKSLNLLMYKSLCKERKPSAEFYFSYVIRIFLVITNIINIISVCGVIVIINLS